MSSTRKKYVALIHSDLDLTRKLILRMNEANVTLSIFQSNDELFESMNTRIPDLIVSQLSSPKINALKIISAIRSFPGEERPRIIVIGRRQNKSNKALIMQVGVEEYIEMPTTYLRVQSAVQNCLKKITPRKQRNIVSDDQNDEQNNDIPGQTKSKPNHVTQTRSVGMWADEVYIQQKPAPKLRPKDFKYPWQKSAEERKKEADEKEAGKPKKRLVLREDAPPEKEAPTEDVQVDEFIETQFKEEPEEVKEPEAVEETPEESFEEEISAENEPLSDVEIEQQSSKMSMKERLAKLKKDGPQVVDESDIDEALDSEPNRTLADIELGVILGGVDRIIGGEDPYEILVNFVEQIDEVMNFTSCSFFLYLDGKLEKIANYDTELSNVESILDIEGADKVLQDNEAYVKDYTQEGGFPVMTHPVYCGNDIIGFFHSRKSNEINFEEEEIRRLANIIDGLNGIIVRYYDSLTLKRAANE